MIIHLLKNGKAMIVGHDSRFASTVPETKGTLTLGDSIITIDGKTEIPKTVTPGMNLASFVSETGKRYSIGSVMVKPGFVVSLNAESDSVIDMLHKMDDLAEKYEDLVDKYQTLKSKIEYDSIGFITGE